MIRILNRRAIVEVGQADQQLSPLYQLYRQQVNMWATRATSIATRRVASQTQQQKRGIINWLVNYPDKVRFTMDVAWW